MNTDQTEQTEFGVVQVIPIESFLNPDKGLDPDAQVDRILEELTSEKPKAQIVGDWPRVRHKPICREGMLVVDGITHPGFTAMLRFCPERPDAGDYEIRRDRKVERGRTIKIMPVPADETNPRVSMLTPFSVRYVVHTVPSERPHTHMVWLVGLSSVENVAETDERDNDAA